MEQKKIRLSLIFSTIIFAIGVAIKSIYNYLDGFGLPFVAVLTLFVLTLYFAISCVEVRKRTIDVVVLSAVSLLLMTILYCIVEWALKNTPGLVDFMTVFCNVISIFSLFFLIYGLIRIVSEFGGKKIKLVETILGNNKKQPKQPANKVSRENRQLKEVMNGDLEQKPMAEKKSVSYNQQNFNSQQNREAQPTYSQPQNYNQLNNQTHNEQNNNNIHNAYENNVVENISINSNVTAENVSVNSNENVENHENY